MVSSDPASLFLQLPWVNYLFIFGSLISIVTAVSMCTFCAKCWRRKSEYDYDPHDKNVSRGGRGLASSHTTYADRRNMLRGMSGDDVANTVSVNVQPIPEQEQPHLTTDTGPIVCLKIQPAKQDFMANESVRTGTVAIPQVIPDVPTDNKDEYLGCIYFNVTYDAFSQLFKVLIKKAEKLPAKDLLGTSDPYVKVALLPNKKRKSETRVKKKKLNPTWNELITFEKFPHQKLKGMSLYLQVLDYDRFSSDDPIGEVVLPLADVPLQKEAVEFVKDLSPCKDTDNGYLGELLVAMCYKATNSRLTIIIMKCVNLKPMNLTGKSDPYVKVYLTISGKKGKKRKTEVKQKKLDPVWNEVMEFEVPFNKTRNTQCVLTVMDYDKYCPNEAIGQVYIGPGVTGSGKKHWSDMINSPKQSIAMWHKIVKY